MPIDVFISYASVDKPHREQLERHLAGLVAQGILRLSSEDKIIAGEDRVRALYQQIDRAAVALVLVTANYLASDKCRAHDLVKLQERRARNDLRIVPIIVAPCLWQSALGGLDEVKVLPYRGRPVTQWPDPDEAWTDVARGIDALARSILAGSASISTGPARRSFVSETSIDAERRSPAPSAPFPFPPAARAPFSAPASASPPASVIPSAPGRASAPSFMPVSAFPQGPSIPAAPARPSAPSSARVSTPVSQRVSAPPSDPVSAPSSLSTRAPMLPPRSSSPSIVGAHSAPGSAPPQHRSATSSKSMVLGGAAAFALLIAGAALWASLERGGGGEDSGPRPARRGVASAAIPSLPARASAPVTAQPGLIEPMSSCASPCCAGSACAAPLLPRERWPRTAEGIALCFSGRDCVPGDCNAPLASDRRFLLRLARVEMSGKPLPGARFCAKKSSSRDWEACLGTSDAADVEGASPGAAMAARVPSTTADLLAGRGLDIVIFTPTTPLARQSSAIVPGEFITTAALCMGLKVNVGPAVVYFYMDDP